MFSCIGEVLWYTKEANAYVLGGKQLSQANYTIFWIYAYKAPLAHGAAAASATVLKPGCSDASLPHKHLERTSQICCQTNQGPTPFFAVPVPVRLYQSSGKAYVLYVHRSAQTDITQAHQSISITVIQLPCTVREKAGVLELLHAVHPRRATCHPHAAELLGTNVQKSARRA